MKSAFGFPSCLLVACLTASLSACVAQRGRVTVLRSYPPRTADYPIFLTEGAVEEPHETIATVQTGCYEEWELRERGRAELRETARRLGGDAVLRIQRQPRVTEKPALLRTRASRVGTKLVTAFYYTGTVVRFIRDTHSGGFPGSD